MDRSYYYSHEAEKYSFVVATAKQLDGFGHEPRYLVGGNFNPNNRNANLNSYNANNQNDNARLRAAVLVMYFVMLLAIHLTFCLFPQIVIVPEKALFHQQVPVQALSGLLIQRIPVCYLL